MTTGERIKAARKKAGMTQATLAEKLGISYVNISQLENDRRSPEYKTLQRIANALNIHIFDLIGIEKELDKYEVEYVVTEKDGSPPSPEILAEIEKFLSRWPREIYDSFSEDQKDKFWRTLTKPLHAQLNDAFDRLNAEGQQKAVDRVEELTEIPRYQLYPAQDPHKSPKAGEEDTAPNPEKAEGES